jgi:uncharacterized phage protein gp47/JayE
LSTYITSAGLTIPTLVELRLDLEASYTAVWGAGVDLSPEGYLGQHIALMSKRDRDLWEVNQELLSARDPDTATGVSLDEVCTETGVTRLAPTAAKATEVLHWLTFTAVPTIPVGSKVKAGGSPTTYSLDSEVSGISDPTGPYKAVRLKIDPNFGDGDTMSITAGGMAPVGTYYEATHGTVENYVSTVFAPGVESSITGSTSRYVAISGGSFLEIVFAQETLVTHTDGLLRTTASYQGSVGNYTCDTYGARALDAYTLDTIVTPISGWESITQPVAGAAGTDTETDTALRLRRLRQLRSGTATEDAIRNAILRVDGVSFADVTSNRDNATDAEGRPAHWMECVVSGGSDASVASAIWTTASAGIGFHGNFLMPPDYPTDTRPVVTGQDGKPHKVNFSRPQAVFAWVEVTVISPNLEESAPQNLLAAIQDAIVAWGNSNMGLGDDMVLQKFYGPIFTVAGIGEVALRHALTATSGALPTYSTAAKITVSSREFATFDAARVVVL